MNILLIVSMAVLVIFSVLGFVNFVVSPVKNSSAKPYLPKKEFVKRIEKNVMRFRAA